MTKKRSFYSYSLPRLQKVLVEEFGLKKYSVTQIFDWVYRKNVRDPELFSNISKQARDAMKDHFSFDLPLTIKIINKSVDGTTKFLLNLTEDNETVEAVLIPAKSGRLTICVSSQVGCAMGCVFCFTGKLGLIRNLKTEEIVAQHTILNDWVAENPINGMDRISNIVFMGQGEPLHNFANVKESIEVFLDPWAYGISQRKITLSTSGLVPQMLKWDEFPPVNLAISLHAVDNDIRSSLMPINKIHDLEKLFAAIKAIPLKAHRHITFEYILIAGLNDRLEDVIALTELLDMNTSKINIIPFNEHPGSEFKRPSDEQIKWFQDELLKRKYVTTTRASKGRDILAACGQLKNTTKK